MKTVETVLFLAHTEPDGTLGRHSREALTAAQGLAASLNAPLLAALFGGEIQPAAGQIAACGAQRICGVSGADWAPARYATDAAAIAALLLHTRPTLVAGRRHRAHGPRTPGSNAARRRPRGHPH